MNEFHHITVLLQEAVDALKVKEDGIYFDLTMGGGGHSAEILKKLTTGKLIGIDQDDFAIRTCQEKFREYGERFIAVHDNFSNLKKIAASLGIDKADGILMDLGVSSPQLDEAERGFSYMQDAPLDMRMDKRKEKSAHTVVNTYSEEELTRILLDYGEERWAARIAKFILEERQEKDIATTGELVEIIKKAIPKAARMDGGHPAKRTFQAIRIEVNNELGVLETVLKESVDLLAPAGRVAAITFHSLEDRLVKTFFQQEAVGCTCPKEFPICVCGKKPSVKIIARKPILPSEKELTENSRSKSSKLRVAEKRK